MTGQLHRAVSPADVPPNVRRGGDIRVLLSPATVGAGSGFMGVVTLGPGERVTEHYHPYSEESLYVVEGQVEIDLDDVPHPLRADQALLVPIGVRHRVRNASDGPAKLVFHLSPLAPRPELGHVDTESAS
ncbi:cupin domain-containing protein [Saccharothrix coeruleofusca]|uniref:cupin domain-containing protein n=1 Tax=Saccharothrix coeruleofusca TaxID=33919 RepID=UPI0016717BD8|nr:cupin domain-containing protein [Saccharothrix coeruleofusca]